MKKSYTLLLPLVLIAALSVLRIPQSARGNYQAEEKVAKATDAPGRYQLQAYGGNIHGYYILDTHTGEVWHGYSQTAPKRVAKPLK